MFALCSAPFAAEVITVMNRQLDGSFQHSAPLHALDGVSLHFGFFFFSLSRRESGEVDLSGRGKGGHMVVKTTVSPSPKKRKVRQKNILGEGKGKN